MDDSGRTPFQLLKWKLKSFIFRSLNKLQLLNVLRWIFKHSPHLPHLVALYNPTGYLTQTGWPKTFFITGCGYAVDTDDQPIPWYTYSIIHFLNERLRPGMTLFEYGSGQSTLYYEKKGLVIDAVERDSGWAKRIQKVTGKNVRVHHVESIAQYNTFIHSLKKKFHIIVVDGMPMDERPTCMKEAVQALRSDGVILLDDTEWLGHTSLIDTTEFDAWIKKGAKGAPQYTAGYRTEIKAMRSQGFQPLHFFGLRPVTNYLNCTSILYRPNNCLNI